MRDRKSVEDSKMFVTAYNSPEFVGVSAKEMATALLHKEFRGPGDTIDAAAYRLQTKHGVDAEIVLQGWRREIRDMKASRWIALFQAYYAAGLVKASAKYDEERARHEPNSALVRLADFVAGKRAEG